MHFNRLASFLFFAASLCGCSSPAGKEQNDSQKKAEVKNTVKDSGSCEWGRAEAEVDFSHDSLMLIQCGIPTVSESQYWKIMARDYHIYLKFAVGCIVDPPVACYNKFMVEKITAKYGAAVFEKASRQADSLYQLENPR